MKGDSITFKIKMYKSVRCRNLGRQKAVVPVTGKRLRYVVK